VGAATEVDMKETNTRIAAASRVGGRQTPLGAPVPGVVGRCMATVNTAIRVSLPTRVRQKLEKVAVSTRRTPAALAAKAIAWYVDDEAAFIAAVEAGLEDSAAGRVVEHAEIEAWVDSLRPRRRAARR
jgi:predicted transcriptional regulator